MNKIFKVVFNKVRGMFVVGSEIIKSHGKSKSTSKKAVASLAAAFLFGVSGTALAGSVNQADAVDGKIVYSNRINIIDASATDNGEGSLRSYGIGITASENTAVEVNIADGAQLIVNNELTGTDRNYGISVVGDGNALTINGDVIVDDKAVGKT
ncbi:MAG: ESPR domain-containing protein [Oxalobacter sp.]|nr:ESPR domain-containing protein [Oxalobacter sp.]